MWRFFKKLYFWYKSRNMITHYRDELKPIEDILNDSLRHINGGFSSLNSTSEYGYELLFKYSEIIDFKIIYLSGDVRFYILTPNITINSVDTELSGVVRNLKNSFTQIFNLSDLNTILYFEKSRIIEEFQKLLTNKGISSYH